MKETMFSLTITYPTGILWTISLEAVNESCWVTIIVTPCSLAKLTIFSDGAYPPVTIINEILSFINAAWASSLSPTIAMSPSSIWPDIVSGCIAVTTILPGKWVTFSLT